MKKTAEEFRNQEKINEVLEEELSEDIKNAPAVIKWTLCQGH